MTAPAGPTQSSRGTLRRERPEIEIDARLSADSVGQRGAGRPRGEVPETPRDLTPGPLLENAAQKAKDVPFVSSFVIWIRRTRLSCVWRGLLFATTQAFHFSLRLKATNPKTKNPGLAAGVCIEVERITILIT